MKWAILLTAAILINICEGGESDDDEESNYIKKYWDGLRMTFGNFSHFPRNYRKAVKRDWELEYEIPRDGSYKCSNGGKFNGIRVIDKSNNQMTLALLYDRNGQIAGYQFLVCDDYLTDDDAERLDSEPAFQEQEIYFDSGTKTCYVLTVYLVPPERICDSKAHARDINTGATIEGIWVQVGPTPADIRAVPLYRSEGLASGGWRPVGCFNKMGFHNGYKLESLVNTECKQLFPVYGLYRNGYLIGAAIHVLFDKYEERKISARLEDLPPKVVNTVIRGPPCVETLQNILFHVYAIHNPLGLVCTEDSEYQDDS